MTKAVRLLIVIFLCMTGISTLAQNSNERQELLDEIEKDLLENILPFWINNSIDPDGGFYGVIDNSGNAVKDAPKGGVLNARILWTFSNAYGVYGLDEYREMADRAQREIIDRFIDPAYGGVYWQINPDGSIYDGTKQTYCLAYGIYGLSDQGRISGDLHT